MLFKIFFLIVFNSNHSLADTILNSIADDVVSPITTEADTYLYIGIMSTGFMYVFFQNDVILGIQNETQENKPLGDASVVGDLGGQLIPNALYAGGMLTSYYFSENETYKKNAYRMFRASLYSGIFTNVIKGVVHERRPNGVGTSSFPSGHTTTAFAFAALVGAQHEWYWGLAAYSFATFVGYSRINDNKHYLHDVVAGASIGIAYGLGVYYVDQANENHSESSQASTIIFPKFDGGFGLQLIHTF